MCVRYKPAKRRIEIYIVLSSTSVEPSRNTDGIRIWDFEHVDESRLPSVAKLSRVCAAATTRRGERRALLRLLKLSLDARRDGVVARVLSPGHSPPSRTRAHSSPTARKCIRVHATSGGVSSVSRARISVRYCTRDTGARSIDCGRAEVCATHVRALDIYVCAFALHIGCLKTSDRSSLEYTEIAA